MNEPDALARAQTQLRDQSDDLSPQWKELVEALVAQCAQQKRLLDRLTRIADGFQAAERQRGQTYFARYERQVSKLEKILRISDQYQVLLRELTEKLDYVSNNDALTGLPNRRFMSSRLTEAVALAARRPEHTFALAVADIDRFKSINDTHGHLVGDAVLKEVARGLRADLREYDICARWGGEEFLLFLPQCDARTATNIAERLRERIAHLEIPPTSKVTVSLGVTVHIPGESLDETLQRADRALYEAKETGRNRVVTRE